MKSSSQRKRKVLGVSLKGNKATGSPENCAKRNYKRRESTASEEFTPCLPEKQTREKPSDTTQSGGGKLHRDQSIKDIAGVQDLELQNKNKSTPLKIKLQLFPINSTTRIKVEKDGHNPFLELTLSLKKKISSIIKHLKSKWGSSDPTTGEIMLFPDDVRLERISSCSRWTSNCAGITAGEVYAALGSPAIFRLRYGWCSDLHFEASEVSLPSMGVEEKLELKNVGANDDFSGVTFDQNNKSNDTTLEVRDSINIHDVEDVTVTEQRPLPIPVDDINKGSLLPWEDSLTSLSIGGLLSEVSLLNNIKSGIQKSESKSNIQPIELVSDVSVGALLSDASLLDKINNPEVRPGNKSSFLITQSMSNISTGGMLSSASFQIKNYSPDLKTGKEAGCQLIDLDSELSIGGLISEASLHGNASASDPTSSKYASGQRSSMERGALPSRAFFPWDDDGSISLSIGGLQSEDSFQARFNDCDSKSKQSSAKVLSGLPTLVTSKASAASQHNQPLPMQKQPLHESFSSILDAEETCHAFSFKHFRSSKKDSVTSKG